MKRTKLSKSTEISASSQPAGTRGSILALDPSLRAFGWAIISPDGAVKAAGVIKTEPSGKKIQIRKGDDLVRRINEITHTLNGIRKVYSVKLIVAEQPHGSQSAQAAKAIATVIALTQVISYISLTSIEWYSEGDCKMAAAGSRSVAKKEMIKLMRKKFKDAPFTGVGWKDEAIADALAVYNLASRQSAVLPMIQKNFTYLDPGDSLEQLVR